MAKKRQKKQQQNFFPFIKWFWILFGAGVFSIVLIFLLASWGAFGEMPTFERLENPTTNLATEFISSDGETLGKLYLNDNRTPVTYEGLPQNLVNALSRKNHSKNKRMGNSYPFGKAVYQRRNHSNVLKSV